MAGKRQRRRAGVARKPPDVRTGFGSGSRQIIGRIVDRQVFYGDAHSEIHLTLAEHEPKPGRECSRTFLHIHAHSESGRKPAALSHPQLATFINRLRDILVTMSTSPGPAPTVDVIHTATKHRVRRLPPEAALDAAEPPPPLIEDDPA